MVATAHWADRFLLVDLSADENSRTAGRRRFAPLSVRPIGLRAPWSGAHRPLGANDLGALAFGAPHWGDASLNRPPDLS